jgi:hypothetical protein
MLLKYINPHEDFLEEFEDLYLGMLASQALAEELELILHDKIIIE